MTELDGEPRPVPRPRSSLHPSDDQEAARASEVDTWTLRALADATRSVAAARRAQAAAVADARRAGVAWSRIAVVLGVTRQGAKKRFGEPSPL